MKLKIIIFALFLAVFSFNFAYAIEWLPTNQKTIGWNVVTKLVDGNDIPAGDTIQYQVYKVADGANKDTAVKLGSPITALQAVITLTTEGKWLVGVSAERMRGGVLISQATITWSDMIDVTYVPVPFGFVFYIPTEGVRGLQTQEQ
jgi:hypothetical protein